MLSLYGSVIECVHVMVGASEGVPMHTLCFCMMCACFMTVCYVNSVCALCMYAVCVRYVCPYSRAQAARARPLWTCGWATYKGWRQSAHMSRCVQGSLPLPCTHPREWYARTLIQGQRLFAVLLTGMRVSTCDGPRVCMACVRQLACDGLRVCMACV